MVMGGSSVICFVLTLGLDGVIEIFFDKNNIEMCMFAYIKLIHPTNICDLYICMGVVY